MKIRASLLLACLLALLSVPCHAEPLRIGVLPVLDTLPLQVALHDGLFEEQGIEVELIPFASALERDTAMQSGQLDGYFGDLLATLLLIQSGVDMRIATVSYSTMPGQRMFALLAAPDKVAEGALSVGISRSTIIEFVLDRMVESGDLDSMAFDITEIKKIPIRMQMLLSGQIDTAVLPEPLVSLAEGQGASIVLTDENLDMVVTVVCLHSSRMDKLSAFLAAYAKAVETLNGNPEAYRDLMAETCRIPPDMASDFPVYAFPGPSLPSQEEVDRVQAWLMDKDMLKARFEYETLMAR